MPSIRVWIFDCYDAVVPLCEWRSFRGNNWELLTMICESFWLGGCWYADTEEPLLRENSYATRSVLHSVHNKIFSIHRFLRLKMASNIFWVLARRVTTISRPVWCFSDSRPARYRLNNGSYQTCFHLASFNLYYGLLLGETFSFVTEMHPQQNSSQFRYRWQLLPSH